MAKLIFSIGLALFLSTSVVAAEDANKSPQVPQAEISLEEIGKLVYPTAKQYGDAKLGLLYTIFHAKERLERHAKEEGVEFSLQALSNLRTLLAADQLPLAYLLDPKGSVAEIRFYKKNGILKQIFSLNSNLPAFIINDPTLSEGFVLHEAVHILDAKNYPKTDRNFFLRSRMEDRGHRAQVRYYCMAQEDGAEITDPRALDLIRAYRRGGRAWTEWLENTMSLDFVLLDRIQIYQNEKLPRLELGVQAFADLLAPEGRAIVNELRSAFKGNVTELAEDSAELAQIRKTYLRAATLAFHGLVLADAAGTGRNEKLSGRDVMDFLDDQSKLDAFVKYVRADRRLLNKLTPQVASTVNTKTLEPQKMQKFIEWVNANQKIDEVVAKTRRDFAK